MPQRTMSCARSIVFVSHYLACFSGGVALCDSGELLLTRHSRPHSCTPPLIMSEEEFPDATVDEVLKCGLVAKAPPPKTLATFGIELLDQLFTPSSLTPMRVVKKKLTGGGWLLTTLARAPNLDWFVDKTFIKQDKVPPEEKKDKKFLWIFRTVVVALSGAERRAVLELRDHKPQFEECLDYLKKHRVPLPSDQQKQLELPESAEMLLDVSTSRDGKASYIFHRTDLADSPDTPPCIFGSVVLYVPRNATWLTRKKDKHTIHYLVTRVRPAHHSLCFIFLPPRRSVQ
jgi:hypothetical protein